MADEGKKELKAEAAKAAATGHRRARNRPKRNGPSGQAPSGPRGTRSKMIAGPSQFWPRHVVGVHDQLRTWSTGCRVGQVGVAELVATYHGIQRLITDNRGEAVYGGSTWLSREASLTRSL